jgi:hypothetical protein
LFGARPLKIPLPTRTALHAATLTLGLAVPAAAADGLAILPASTTLSGPGASQRLVVETRSGGAFTGDLTPRARFVSSNPRIVMVDAQGTLRPVSDGAATVTAIVGQRRITSPVRVHGAKRPTGWSFANHVLPVLTKAGCNSGACHGASAGKGGLKLTLRGYDAAMDHATLTRQALGRRIVPTDPARSLVLQKAAMVIPHGGGMRFKVESPEYRMLYQWIAAGCPAPSPKEIPIRRLEVYPPEAVLKVGEKQQVVVRAVFSDGRTEDVTRWVKYGTIDDTVAGIDDEGTVTVKGSGEAAVTMWYLNKVAFARIASPYPNAVSPEVFSKAERFNFIDDLVLKKLQALRIRPAALSTDEQFIRRAYLDAAGILPTPEEVEAFVRDTGADKRAALVDRLMTRSEFADYWAYKWSDLLLVSTRKLPSKGMWSFYNWIREGVAENKPWDRFVREIITASGSTLRNGAANYYVLHKDPIDLTETTSQAFLGMSITCSRCHNHPLEKWTLNDYYGMANLFGRVRMKNGDTAGETLVFAADSGDVPRLLTGVPLPPKPLDGTPIPLDAAEDRREHLARWLTTPENPYFARSFVNRVWRNFMGRGLVEAEDDLRLTNPPSNEELLAAVTRDFTSSGFDVRKLVRTIMTSAAYQRSSTPAKGSEADQKFYASYVPRRLSAEVLLDTLSQVTGAPTEFPGYPRGMRAMQLPDATVVSYFLTAFGRPERTQTCSCERQEEPNVAQALHLSNGDTINGKLRASGNTVERLLKEGLADDQLVERLYLLAFSRRPTDLERTRVRAALGGDFPKEGPARREVVEDLLSALLTSKEFLFNH